MLLLLLWLVWSVWVSPAGSAPTTLCRVVPGEWARCWQPHVLAADGESVESSQALLELSQGFTTGGGGEPWALASGPSCAWQDQAPVWVLRAEPYSVPNRGGEDCVAAVHGSNSSTCAFSKYLLSCYRTGTDLVCVCVCVGGGYNSEEILLLKELRAWKLNGDCSA